MREGVRYCFCDFSDAPDTLSERYVFSTNYDLRHHRERASAAICGGLKPQPSPLMLRHPFAGHTLGLGNLVGGHFAGDQIPVFLRLLVTLHGR